MTNLELIRQKCIEANPKIGRLPEYPYNPDAAKAIVALEEIAGKRQWNEEIEQTASLMIENYRQQQAGDYRAMLEGQYHGRPISLADVLLAMIKIGKLNIAINPMGYFFDADEKDGGVIAAWNLRKDDLNDQSEETINFLASLLQ